MSKVTPPAFAGADRLTVKVKVVVPVLPSFSATSLMLSPGCGACTVVVAFAELLALFASGVDEETVAVLLIVEPAAPFAVATRVIVAEDPLASDVNVIVRSLPEPPPQTPPL